MAKLKSLIHVDLRHNPISDEEEEKKDSSYDQVTLEQATLAPLAPLAAYEQAGQKCKLAGPYLVNGRGT